MSDRHKPRADDLPLWALRVVIYGGSGYAGLSIVSSSVALGMLAWAAGYHDPRAVLFGLGFDVAAGVTGTAWAAGRPGSWWAITGRRATLGLFAASLAFNAAEVLNVENKLPAEALLAVAVCVSLVFPALALVFGHLVLTARTVWALATAAARTADDKVRTTRAPRTRAPRDEVRTPAHPPTQTAAAPVDTPPAGAAVPTDAHPGAHPALHVLRTGAEQVDIDPDEARAKRDALAEQWVTENPQGGERALSRYLGEQGYPLSPTACRKYLAKRAAS